MLRWALTLSGNPSFCCCRLVLHIFCCILENKPSLSNIADLNPIDYRIWGWMQERMYKTLVRDHNDLKQHVID